MEDKVLSADKSARGICNMCGVFIKRSDGSPTLMKTHLEKYHPKEYKKYQQKTIGEAERDYLESLKFLEKRTKKKS